MKSSASKWCIALVAIACIALTGGFASAQNAAGLAAVGASDPANGYPKWYMDRTGLQLAPCLDTTAADPCGLIAGGAIPNPAAAIVFPTNFPDELFYHRLVSKISGIGGGTGTAVLSYALEGAFGGATGTAADGAGAQVVFARFRFRVTAGLVPGSTYTLTSPYGTQSFVATAAGTINFTDDRGCLAAPPACDFTLALVQPNVGPFLTWDPAASVPPAGFIGHPAIDHAIVGSPFGTNLFRISGPNVGGSGVNVVETNLFSVIGKIFVRAATSTSLSSTPNPSVTGQAVTLRATVAPAPPATGVPTGTVTFKDGASTLGTPVTLVNGVATLTTSTLAVGTHSLTAVYSGDLDFATSTSLAVTQTVNNAPAPAPAPAPGATDSVSVTLAQFIVAKNQLRAEGANSRIGAGGPFAASVEIHAGAAVGGVCTGAVIGTTTVGAQDGKWKFQGGVTPGPTTICVKSSGGGVGTSPVTRK